MKRRVITVMTAAAFVVGISISPANAHVSVQSKGYTVTAGQSSRLWMSLGHGCTYKNVKYGTSVFVVEVPAAAGKPTPEFHQGFKTSVVASTTVDANKVPDYYIVQWSAKAKSWAIDDGTFYDFGLKVTFNSTPQQINLKTTQICYAPQADGTKKPLYLNWHITDGTKKAASEDTEWGPAPSITTVAAVK